MINLKLAGAAAFLVIASMVLSSFAVAQQAAGTIARGGGGFRGGGMVSSGGGFRGGGVAIGRPAFGGGGGGFVTSRPGFIGQRGGIDPGFGKIPGGVVSRPAGVIGERAGISGGRWHGRHWRHGWGGGLGYWPYDDGYYDDSYTYDVEPEVEVVADGESVAYCMRRFRSYDSASGTYLGYDGLRHACP